MCVFVCFGAEADQGAEALEHGHAHGDAASERGLLQQRPHLHRRGQRAGGVGRTLLSLATPALATCDWICSAY